MPHALSAPKNTVMNFTLHLFCNSSTEAYCLCASFELIHNRLLNPGGTISDEMYCFQIDVMHQIWSLMKLINEVILLDDYDRSHVSRMTPSSLKTSRQPTIIFYTPVLFIK